MTVNQNDHQTSNPIASGCGGVLADLRRSQGRSGADIARAASLSRRTLTKIEQGDDSVAFGSYLKVAEVLEASWLFKVFGDNAGTAKAVPRYYLTGASALSLPAPGMGSPALWYTHGLKNPRSWQIAGASITGSNNLLGVGGLWDATDTMAALGVSVQRIWAASYERAVFDLLYHFCEVAGKPVPNIQSSDIDDVVDLSMVKNWIDNFSPFLSVAGTKRMGQWLEA